MLKGIDKLLTPDLLRLLADMGHDDALVLADANFTAVRLAGSAFDQQLAGDDGLGRVQVERQFDAADPVGRRGIVFAADHGGGAFTHGGRFQSGCGVWGRGAQRARPGVRGRPSGWPR